MSQGVDAACWEMFFRQQFVTEDSFFYGIDEKRLGLFPQILSLFVEMDNLPFRTICHFLAQSQVFKACDAKCNACV